jgi:hypothetical protein
MQYHWETVFLRQEDRAVSGEVIFAQAFAEGYTAWEQSVAVSTGHYRVVGYEFSKIRRAVEFECGGY